MNITELRKEYENGLNPDSMLDNIYKTIEQDQMNDFITLTKNTAYQCAEEYAERRSENKILSPIDGVTVSIKDNFAMASSRMTCASRILEDFISPYHSTAVQRVLDAGGIVTGKTNMDEFAMGSSTENSYFGYSQNPIDRDVVPGGSSGGSAVSVKSGHSILSIGSDTGGSVRQPAACCGIVGFKPSYGTISRYGLTAFSSSLDTVGVMSDCVADASMLFDVLRGRDSHDSTIRDIVKHNDTEKTIGYLSDIEGLHPDIAVLYEKRMSNLKNSGYKCKKVSIPYLAQSIAIYQIISMCEASSNLARYDGIKYGLHTKEAKSMFEIYSNVRGRGFGKEVKRRIMTGTYFLSHENAKYYLMSRDMRKKLYAVMKEIFNEVSFIIMPTTLNLPFKIGERVDDPLSMHLSDSLTAFCNLANLPAININAGSINKLPAGLQIIADSYYDLDLLAEAENIEKIWSINE